MPVTAAARAGGGGGGGGGGGFGGSYSSGRSTWFNTAEEYVAIGYVGYSGVKMAVRLRKKWRNRVRETAPIDPKLAAQFEPLFTAVEAAWSVNQQADLATLMQPDYFLEQKKILDRWAIEGKLNKVDDLKILNLKQEVTPDKNRPHVVVFAEARDYFVKPKETKTIQQTAYRNCKLKSFQEVWELAYNVDSKLIVTNIRQ